MNKTIASWGEISLWVIDKKWYSYPLKTFMLRTHAEKIVFSEEKIRMVTHLELIKCLKEIK